MEHQEHFGKKFYKDHKAGYWICTQKKKIRAHVWVWINFHGPIPKGMHIHHKDGNKSNNAIENLCILSVSDHVKEHMTEERKEWARKLVDEIRPLTKEWHASAAGKAWHRYHADKNNFGKWDLPTKKCKCCTKEFKPKTHHNEFCTNKCKSKWRRKEGLDNIVGKCLICDKEFEFNKYHKTQTCSPRCRVIFGHSKKG